MDSSSLERRKSPRIHVAIPVQLTDAHGFSLHSSHDISVGGLFFDRAIPNAVGSRITVSFKLPGDDQPIVVAGEIANVPDEKSFGMGVRFINLKPHDRDKLEQFLRTQEQETP
ncbi:MAG: PilZ domain-containing protein [Myxococcaceae bacterium]